MLECMFIIHHIYIYKTPVKNLIDNKNKLCPNLIGWSILHFLWSKYSHSTFPPKRSIFTFTEFKIQHRSLLGQCQSHVMAMSLSVFLLNDLKHLDEALCVIDTLDLDSKEEITFMDSVRSRLERWLISEQANWRPQAQLYVWSKEQGLA